MTSALVFLSAVLFLTGKVLCHPVKYDQRQEGDLNVRTDVEDVVFVVVPPQDLVTAGMGIVAATAADLLRKNYGGIGPERWAQRTPPKHGFVTLEKSPYKIDLEKSGFQVKKISPTGDPNRYNFHESKNPSKSSQEVKVSTPVAISEKPATSTTTTTEKMIENMEEMQSTTENKTVKKDLKPEEPKKEMTEEKVQEKVAVKPEKKLEDIKPKIDVMTKGEQPLRVIGADSKDPISIFRLEDCGPEAYRDSSGKCVYKKTDNSSN